MSQSVKTILEAIAPVVAENPLVDTFISIATGVTNTCFYGDNANYAIALRTAHIATLSTRAGGSGDGGTITSKKEGDLSIGFGSTTGSNSSDSDLDQTSYGIQLKDLRKSSAAAVGVTGGNDSICSAIFPRIIGGC